jgi:proline dehydrogenase
MDAAFQLRTYGMRMQPGSNIDFDDTETAFRHYSTYDLLKAKFLFQVVVPILAPHENMGDDRAQKWADRTLRIPLVGERLIRHVGPFAHFCGGVSINDCSPTIAKLGAGNIRSILDYSAEGLATESDSDRTRDETLEVIEKAKHDANRPFAVFKVTGLGRIELLAQASASPTLESVEQAELDRVVNRVRRICQAAHDANCRILIDAEETWIQTAIDEMALSMMKAFNHQRPVVYNTLQMYRVDRLAYLETLHRIGIEEGFIPGIKLVRGAYMEAERAAAMKRGQPSPIHPTKEITDDAFNAALSFCFDHIDNLALFAGTHNATSARLLTEHMARRGLSPADSRVECSQLLGMGDNISYTLADRGFNTSKYVPYGPVRAAIPYLIRRARENSSIKGQVSRELALLNRELQRRWPRLRFLWGRTSV